MNLRRWITALAVLALFAAIGSAQITSNQVTCTVSPASDPNVRAEGTTDRVGDVLITCINGLQLSSGNAADRITITVNYSAPITNVTEGPASLNTDVVLTIDEPNSLSNAAATELGITGYGPNAAIMGVCTVANQATLVPATNQVTACPAYSYAAGVAGYFSTSATNLGGGNAINVYQGVIGANGTSVKFSNVPFVPPYVNTAAQGTLVSRVYRIAGVRVNPNGQASITATVAPIVTNTSDVSTFNAVQNPTVTVGTVTASLVTSVVPSPLSVCIQTQLTPAANAAQLPASASYLKFTENFGTAFKTRVVPIVAADNATGTGADLQANTQLVNGTYSGGAYTNAGSESGILFPLASLPQGVIGLANNGTRLKAVFANLNTAQGTKYYVSVNNITDFNTPVAANKTPATPGDTTAAPYAVLQTQGSEVAAYAASAGATTAGTGAVLVPVVQLTVASNGTAEAVWEVTNTDLQSDTYTFAVYAVYAANALGANPATAATVALGYAPTNGSASTNPVGVTLTNIPRFVAPGAAVPLLALLPCRTTLLFPYVTSFKPATGPSWQTGVAIENTGLDPMTTTGGTGTCTLSFYGAGAPPSVQTPPIAPGSGYAFDITDPGLTGQANTNWTGYIFAVCNFNYGHGFAFIEDGSPQGNAMGYLADVLNQQSTNVTRGAFTLGESLGQ